MGALFWRKNTQMPEHLAMTDKHARDLEKDDKFKISSYIYGLKDFILRCNTPMTIAIQGDWGTGKTSIMEMVLNEVDKDCKEQSARGKVFTIKFNTWEHSQFSLSAQLPAIMIQDLVESIKLEAKDVIPEDKKKSFYMSANNIKNLVGVAATFSIGLLTHGMVQLGNSFADSLPDEDKKEDGQSPFTRMNEIKKDFESLIECIAPSENDRIVIFIDDLDRLEPAKAVETLEVLKNFLECDKCVFVLAIDYKVVQRGVKDKYGSDFDDEKAKNFFDKIIQVPFQVPVGNYDLKEFMESCIKDIGLDLGAEIDTLTELIKSSVGRNPRAIKRVFNALLLSIMVAGNTKEAEDIVNDKKKVVLLFGLLCLQQAGASIYEYITVNQDELDAEKFEVLKTLDEKQISAELDVDIDQKELDSLSGFMPQLYNLIDVDNKNGISADEMSVFQEVLAFSAITAPGEGKENRGSDVVTSLSQLDYQYEDNSREQFERIVPIVADVGEDAHVTMKNCNSGYISVTGDFDRRGTTYCYLTERASGIHVCVTVPNEKDYKKMSDNLKEIAAKYEQKGRDITMNFDALKDEESVNDFKELLHFGYEMYRKKKG